jgi:hypothetical protein
MRPLVIDAYVKRQAQKIVDYALDPKRWYRPYKDARVPGDDPRLSTYLNSYRCVFTITEEKDGRLFRHLSISVPSDGYPHIAAAFTIAELFGFTGWDGKSLNSLPKDWMAHVSQEDHCIVLGQPYVKAVVPA